MKKLFVPALFAAALFAPQLSVAQTYMGFTTKHDISTEDRKNGKAFNANGLEQGVAVHVSAEKAAALKGARITGIRLATATKNLNDTKIFITKTLGGENVAERSLASSELKGSRAEDYKFATPIELDGSEFYVGYTTSKKTATTVDPCLFESTNDFSAGLVWAYNGEGWTDTSANGDGVPTLQLLVENAPATLTDVVMKPAKPSSFYKVNAATQVTAEVFNFGTVPVTSMTLQSQMGNGEVKTLGLTNLNIQPNHSYTFNVDGLVPQDEGHSSLKLSVLSVNGAADADASDNTASSSFYVYPQEMQRRILLEKFTGQDCSNCPRGEEELNRVVNADPDKYVVVTHHTYPSASGYDIFAMDESFSIGAWFFNSNNSYAPAAMVNRAPWKSGLSTVVFGDTNSTGGSLTPGLTSGIAIQNGKEPYVGVNLVNTYDAATRKGQVKVSVKTYRMPSNEEHRLNLCLTQDKVYAYQSGGSDDYEHNHALRQMLTGAWGEAIELKEGETVERTYAYEIPDAIESTAQGQGYKLPTDPKNMHLVAFVSDATENPLTCVVYNANTIGVTVNGGTTGIKQTSESVFAAPRVSDGQLSILGIYGKAQVFNLAGQQVAVLTGHDSGELAKGVYVVRVDGKASKVLVK